MVLIWEAIYNIAEITDYIEQEFYREQADSLGWIYHHLCMGLI